MPHYNAYDSFKTKKSMEKKQRAKERTFGKKNETIDNFMIENCVLSFAIDYACEAPRKITSL